MALMGPATLFDAYRSQIFDDFDDLHWLCLQPFQMLRSRDLVIFVPSLAGPDVEEGRKTSGH